MGFVATWGSTRARTGIETIRLHGLCYFRALNALIEGFLNSFGNWSFL
jgi:hypothetical protein